MHHYFNRSLTMPDSKLNYRAISDPARIRVLASPLRRYR